MSFSLSGRTCGRKLSRGNVKARKDRGYDKKKRNIRQESVFAELGIGIRSQVQYCGERDGQISILWSKGMSITEVAKLFTLSDGQVKKVLKDRRTVRV